MPRLMPIMLLCGALWAVTAAADAQDAHHLVQFFGWESMFLDLCWRFVTKSVLGAVLSGRCRG